MHRSRLYGLFVDAPRADAPRAVAFWSAALGAAPASPNGETDPFTALDRALPGGLSLEVQAVDDAARYHVDIETDDIEAEVARLTALGATQVAWHPGWCVLRAPAGHLLCVVPVQSDVFDAQARTWS